MTSLTSMASRISRPELCQKRDFEAINQAFIEFEESGFGDQLYDKGIGTRIGDCNDIYSLLKIANFQHRQNAPKPSCAIIFIFDQEMKTDQARWVLDELGGIFYRNTYNDEINLLDL